MAVGGEGGGGKSSIYDHTNVRVYRAQATGSAVRLVIISSAVVSTLAGSTVAATGCYTDGVGSFASFGSAAAVAIDSSGTVALVVSIMH